MATTTPISSKITPLSDMSPTAKQVITQLTQTLVIPLIGILIFLVIWSYSANAIDTSLGKFPGPAAVWEQFQTLYTEHKDERTKETAFYERQEVRNAARMEQDPSYVPKIRAYTGKRNVFRPDFH